MREILFRGKRLDNGEWIEGGYRHEKVGDYFTAVFIIEPLTSGVWESHRVDPDTVGQYTGMNDKNGKRIFEGDIIDRKSIGGESLIGWVSYEPSEFVTTFPGFLCPQRGILDGVDAERIEVIGNIHDNPELLPKKTQELEVL